MSERACYALRKPAVRMRRLLLDVVTLPRLTVTVDGSELEILPMTHESLNLRCRPSPKSARIASVNRTWAGHVGTWRLMPVPTLPPMLPMLELLAPIARTALGLWPPAPVVLPILATLTLLAPLAVGVAVPAVEVGDLRSGTLVKHLAFEKYRCWRRAVAAVKHAHRSTL